MNDAIVLIPPAMVEFMDVNGPWGHFTTRYSGAESVYSVVAISSGDGDFSPIPSTAAHFLDVGDFSGNGVWYTVEPEADYLGFLTMRQQAPMTFDLFREVVPAARHPGDQAYLAVTYCPKALGMPPWIQMIRAWHVEKNWVFPIAHDLFYSRPYSRDLEPAWPGDLIAGARALVVGCGSIGGAAARSLAAFGVGAVDLVDPDRFKSHNVARHVLGSIDVGRFKVDALAENLRRDNPEIDAVPHVINAIEDADKLWSLLAAADMVICSVDGVAPRRVISHLARRAGREAVLACVLADGRFGEVVRLQPIPDKGCLECQRHALEARGGIDLEPTLDRGYGEGTRHRPMTAVGGDLHLVGAVAAKVAVAGYMAQSGDVRQYLAGDIAYIALRPERGWNAPFDMRRAGEVRWERAAPPRRGCATCAGT